MKPFNVMNIKESGGEEAAEYCNAVCVFATIQYLYSYVRN